jgi:hypothetical protein
VELRRTRSSTRLANPQNPDSANGSVTDRGDITDTKQPAAGTSTATNTKGKLTKKAKKTDLEVTKPAQQKKASTSKASKRQNNDMGTTGDDSNKALPPTKPLTAAAKRQQAQRAQKSRKAAADSIAPEQATDEVDGVLESSLDEGDRYPGALFNRMPGGFHRV